MNPKDHVAVGVAAALGFGAVVARGPDAVLGPEEAAFRLAALDPRGVEWIAAWGISGYLPWFWLLAAGLWYGGRVLGGAGGAFWSVVAGMLAPGVVAQAPVLTPAFPAIALVAVAGAALVDRRWIVCALAGAAALGMAGPALNLDLRPVFAAAGLAVLPAVVLALLTPDRDPPPEPEVYHLHVSGPRGRPLAPVLGLGALALGCLLGLDDGAPAAAVPLAMAGAAAARTAWGARGLLALGAGALAQPVLLPRAEEPWWKHEDVHTALDWLDAHGGGRVAVDLDPPMHVGLLTLRARERGLPLSFVHPGDGDLGFAMVRTAAAWRDLLPVEAQGWETARGGTIRLWDRGLPAMDVVEGTSEGHFPARQALFVRLPDGEVRGPLLKPASSAEVVRTAQGWQAFYVRDQEIWRARSDDGLAWSAEAPLGIAGFDPSPVRLADGTWRLYLSELSGNRTDVDPAEHPTRIVSFTSPDLEAFTREPGERLAGTGLVDPSVVATRDGWEMYYTVERSKVRRATSADGLAFVPDDHVLPGYTVPHATAEWLVVQRPALRETLLYGWPRGATAKRPRPLELCGTGASVAGDRVYFTRDAEAAACGPPLVIDRPTGFPWDARGFR